MKKDKQSKNSPDLHDKISISSIIRTYLTMIALTHKNVGTLRMIAAYYFVFFAFISMLFTIFVPMTSDFLPPTAWEKAESRIISGGMMIANILVYGIIMTWRRSKAAPMPIRIAFIGVVFYLDVFLVSRTIYELMRDRAFL